VASSPRACIEASEQTPFKFHPLQVLLIAMHFYSPALSSKSSPASLLRVLITCALVVASGLCKETGFTFFGLFLGLNEGRT